MQLNFKSMGVLQDMTKSNKFLITGAAVAGLLAGTSASIKASNLLPGLKSAATAQDTDKPAATDKKVKEKHACKGQNSCKGKGGCKSSDNGCKRQELLQGQGRLRHRRLQDAGVVFRHFFRAIEGRSHWPALNPFN